jgi:hypothetical protein
VDAQNAQIWTARIVFGIEPNCRAERLWYSVGQRIAVNKP